MRHLGATWGDPANTFKVPGVTLADLALQYDLGVLSAPLRGATLALNVSNLGNKQYVASCTSRLYCFIGQDRTAVATLGYRW
ncbi:Ferrichrome-iron receptor precursor [compost metagenome]